MSIKEGGTGCIVNVPIGSAVDSPGEKIINKNEGRE